MRGGVLAGLASGAALIGAVTVSASLLLPPPAAPGDAATVVPMPDATVPEDDSAPAAAASDLRVPAEEQGGLQIRPAQSVPLPAGSEFGRPPADDPVAPGSPDTSAIAAGTADRLAPMPDDASPAPAPAAASVARPAPATVSPLGTAPAGAADAGPPPASTDDVPVASGPDLSTRRAPAADRGPDGTPTIETVATSAPAPADPATDALPPVSADAVPETSGSLERSRIALVPEAEVLTPPPVATIAPEVVSEPPEASSPPRRLVLDSARADAAVDAGSAADRGGDALATNAVAFDDVAGLPRLAVVLFDVAGSDDDAIGPDALEGLDVAVTVAIDPARPDAADTARAWRSAGYEVALLATPPVPGSTAQDVEVALAGARAAVPQAVAMLDGGQGDSVDRETRAALLPALAAAGLGYVGPADGLGSDVASARAAGIPARSLYRTLDGAGESAPVIARYLDRAAFEADRTGSIVVSGHATARMRDALRAWLAGARAATVVTAPLSAVLTDPRTDASARN